MASGLSQLELARRAGISRQALSAVEAGLYQPGVDVALRLAHELGETVEALFGKARIQRCVAHWAGPARREVAGPQVALARVLGGLVAVPLPAPQLSLAPPAGRLDRLRGRRAEITAFRSREEIETSVLIAGCDPAVTILGDWLVRRRVPAALVPLYASSTAALSALIEGRAHIAGLHLRDPVSGEYNLAFARRALGRRRAIAVNFARWELGLAVPAGNPSGFAGFEDLARPRVRIVNRPRGAGARAALDDAIAQLGLNARTVRGYEHEVAGHLEVAAAIASAQADLGVTIRLAAKAYGLDFIPVREERYDLLVLESHMSTPSVKAVLDALTSSRFATELAALCAYDTGETGRILARLP
jgi:molybdopterin molybdotransferase/putative molybdopterin biosynthesis protein